MEAFGNDVRNEIIAWAEGDPRVRRVWVFGSRATGSFRPDSDLDVAVEVEPVGDSEESVARWILLGDRWQSQLQDRIEGLEVDLDWFDADGSTPRVQRALDAAKILIYERILMH